MSAYSQQSKNINKTWILMFLFVGIVSLGFYVIGVQTKNPYLPLIGLALSLGQAGVSYWFGGNIAIASSGGQKIDESSNPQIYNLVANLSKIGGIEVPEIYISPDLSANAFACGRDPKNAKICLNQGLLNILNKDELEGVIAHELAHIKNRDILIMTVTMVLVSVISFVTDIGFRMMFWQNNDDEDKNPLMFVAYIAVMIMLPIVGTVIQLSVSREREFLADATAVTFTRYPNGLINALNKLYQSPIPSEHYSTATNHFFIAPPKQNFGEKVQNLFSTHPSIEERVLALSKM
jgi:heat shock protein HtpX